MYNNHIYRYLSFGGVAGLEGMGVGAISVPRAEGKSWNRSRWSYFVRPVALSHAQLDLRSVVWETRRRPKRQSLEQTVASRIGYSEWK